MTLPAGVQDHLDRLEPILGDVSARRFFGGFGLYHAHRQFAMVMKDALYLKADAINCEAFVAGGGIPFSFNNRKGLVEVSYFAMDPDADAFEYWVRLAVDASERAAPPKHRSKAAAH